MSPFLATLPPEVQAPLYTGCVVVSLIALLSLLWLLLQIIGWFRPKEAYATREEHAELKAEVRALARTIDVTVRDLERAIGRLEGLANQKEASHA